MKKIIAFGITILVLLSLVLSMVPKVYANFFEDGYAMPDVELTEVLSSQDLQYYDPIKLAEIKENEGFKERFGKILTDNDVAINLDYPIIINNNAAMRFMNKTSYVIDTSFNYARIVNNSIISGQTYFNEDGRAVDSGEYMMVQLPNKLFISADKITFKNAMDTQVFGKHSIYFFDEDFVNVYEYDDAVYHFKAVRSVKSATVMVGNLEMPYPEFYDKLLRVKEIIIEDIKRQDEIKEEIKDIIEQEEEQKVESVGKPSAAIKPDKPVAPEKTPITPPVIKPENPGMEYVKPEVAVSNISTWVYTINGDIVIKDPSSRILGGVVFYVYNEDGELVLRQSVNRTGRFDLSILEPDKTFVVNAQFEYYNRNNLIATEVALENMVVHTKPMDGNVHPVSFGFKTSAYAKPKSMVVESSWLKNTSDYQESLDTLENFYKNTLPYINKITFMFDGGDGVISTNIPSRALSGLKSGQDIRFETNNVLKSKTTYNYIVKAYDKFGNEIIIEPSITGSYTTSKSNPVVRGSTLKTTHDLVELKIQLIDEDSTLSDDGYEMYLYDDNGELLSFEYEYGGAQGYGDSIRFLKDEANVTVKIFNLPSLNRYNVKFIGDYDLANGEGLLVDRELGNFSFLSGELPSGNIHFDNEFFDIGDSYASMNLSVSRSSTSELLNLMTDISTKLKGGSQEFGFQLSDVKVDKIDIEKNYDNTKNALVIQRGNWSEGQPEILLVASKDALINNGAWKTFINSGILGANNENAGYLQVNYLPKTLVHKTTYKYDMKASANINGVKKELNSEFASSEFTTLSIEPIVGYEDFFLAQNFIELYNISSVDEGKTIVNNEYLVQLYDGEILIESYELKVGETKDAIRFDSLLPGKKYKLQFVVPEYKPSVNSETIYDYVLSSFAFMTDEGVSANFDIESIRNGYDAVHDNKFVTNITDISYGTAYNTDTKEEVSDPDSFLTGYIPFNQGSYKVLQYFAAPGRNVRIYYYKADKTYAGVHTVAITNGMAHDEYCLNAFNNSTYKYMRIQGQTGYEKNARFFDMTHDDLQMLVDLEANPDAFEDGISPGTTGFDSANPARSTTDYFPVTPGETLYYKSNRGRYLYFYTQDHKYISVVGAHSSAYNNVVDVPANAAYARFSVENLNKEEDKAAVYSIKNMMVVDQDATFNWSIIDDGNDQFALSKLTSDKQYYIRKYVSKSIDILDYKEEYTKAYPLDTTDGASININVSHDETLPARQAYRYDIIVKYHGREIVLDSFEMDTKNSVYLIRNGYDLKQLQYDSFGTFIAVEDIVEDENSYSVNANFGGTLDFQNHSLKLYEHNGNALIHSLNPGGVVENINLIIENPTDRWFVTDNYGRISNLTYTIKLSEDEFLRMPLMNHNTKDGVIENFVIQFNGNLTAYNEVTTDRNSILVNTNSGIIRNGYTYNTVNDAFVNFVSRKGYNSRSGIISGNSNGNGLITNIYSTVNIASDYDSKTASDGTSKSAGIISGSNGGRVVNVFGVGTRNCFDFNYDALKITNRRASSFDDPLFGHASSNRTAVILGDDDKLEVLLYQNVMFYETKGHKYDDTEMVGSKFDIANLYDEKWYGTNVNSSKQFDISYVSQGYYPLVNSTYGGHLVGQSLNPLPRVVQQTQPEFLDYVVDNVQNDYVDVVFKFNNPSKVDITGFGIDNLTASILEQDTVNDIYEVKVRLNNPTAFVTGYKFSSFDYRTLQGKGTVAVNPSVTLDVSFYKTINNIEEWSQYLCSDNRKLNYNYRLGNTLDFSGISGTEFKNKYRVNYQFNGKLDGNGYAIQNINFGNDQPTANSVLFSTVYYAEIRNIEFRNISWHKTSDSNIDLAIVHDIRNSVVDHVNISNVNFTAAKRVSGFANYANTCDFSNITANNITLRKLDRQDVLYMGGLVADAYILDIRNSYVRNIDILTERVDLAYDVGIGGILGHTSGYTRMQNVYTTGKIKTTSYAGGIAGSGSYSISEAYSDVYMETDGDYNAGIAGTISVDASVKNSFSVGNFIHAISNPLHTNRIISSENYWYLNNNYGYVNQTFNNQIKEEMDSSALLTYEDLQNEAVYKDRILLSDNYDYKDVSRGSLPKLKDTDGNLLPYQNDHYIPSTALKVIKIDSGIEVSGSSEYYNATIRVDHEGYVVDSITIDGMQMVEGYPTEEEIISGVAHLYKLKTYKLNAYDKYNLKVKMHAVSDANQTKELVLSLDYGRPLYWKITDYVSWQSIMESHGYGSENIMVSGTIDLTDKAEVYHNITANRFDGDPSKDNNVVKGYKLNGNANDSNLISTIYTSISNVGFEDINIEMDTEASYINVGIVGIVQGEASDLKFKNCAITGPGNTAFPNSGGAKVSMINRVSGDIHDIEADNITIKVRNTKVNSNNIDAGIVAVANKNIYNITAKNINVDAENGFYVSGVVGFADRKSTEAVTIEKITLTGEDPVNGAPMPNIIKGLNKVGGIVGGTSNVTIIDIFAKNVEVYGYKNDSYSQAGIIGGAVGNVGTFVASNTDEPTVENVIVTAAGTYGRAGGIGGSIITAKDLSAKNVTVKSTIAAGGIAGHNASSISKVTVEKAKVTAEVAAGGIQGIGYSVSGSSVVDSDIVATTENAGGIIGAAAAYDTNGQMTSRYSGNITSSSVNGVTVNTPKAGGGLIGMAHSNGGSASRNYVSNTTVNVGNGGYAGGILGKGDGYSISGNIVNNNNSITNQGGYTGGIAGHLIYKDVSYNTSLNQNFSVANVKGNDYTGGIVGYFDGNITSDSRYTSLYSNINMASIESKGSNVYGFGHMTEAALKGSKHKYHLASYNKATINGTPITESQLCNLTGQSFKIISLEELSNYPIMTNGISDVYYNFSSANWNYMLNMSVRLENFAISYKGKTNDEKPQFKIEGVELKNGEYKLDVALGENSAPIETLDIKIENGVVTQDGSSIITLSKKLSSNYYMTIFEIENGTRTDYAKSHIKNLSSTRTYHEVLVNGKVSNYRKAQTKVDGELVPNESITITIEEPGNQKYKWYRLHKENNYVTTSLVINVTHMASEDTHSLTTNLPGVYYAQGEEDTNHVTEMFRYDGIVYYPFVSDSSIVPIKGQDFIPLAEAYKIAPLATQEPEVTVFPTYIVYPSGVDRVNVEFKDLDWKVDNSNLKIVLTIKGVEYTYPITDKVMTFAYDYCQADGISIRLTDGETTTNSTEHSNDSLRQTIALTDTYYYIDKNHSISGTGENKVVASGNFTHVYDSKAMKYSDNGPVIVDLTSGAESSVSATNGTLLDQTALKEGRISVEDATHNVLYFHDFMYDKDTDSCINEMIFNIDGDQAGFNGSYTRKSNGLVLDFFEDNGEKILASYYLDQKGKLVYDDKVAKLPDKFNNAGISELAFNVGGSTDYVMIKYSTKVYIFDYTTGNVVLDEVVKEASTFSLEGIGQYAMEYFNNFISFLSGDEPITDVVNYDHVINELNRIPNSEMNEINSITLEGNAQISTEEFEVEQGSGYNEEGVISQDGEVTNEEVVEDVEVNIEGQVVANDKPVNSVVSRDYVPVYNPTTRSYDIYTTKEIVENSNPKSENAKVKEAVAQGYKLSDQNSMFNEESKADKGDFIRTRIILYFGIFATVIILLVVLKNKIKRIKN